MADKPSQTRVADIARLMEEWAPAWTAEPWDRVGLMTGRPDARADRVWVALELTPGLLDQALAQGARMLLLHHPPLFKPLADLCSHRPLTARLLRAAAQDLALFAAHTNLDAAPGGVNDALAERLGLLETRPLQPLAGGLAKLTTFLPPDHYEQVAEALFGSGAGRIGQYRQCAFVSQGTGTFLAPEGASPYLGRPGQSERVSELRLETLLPLAAVPGALKALKEAHPYEEPAVDIIPLAQGPAGAGLGRVGRLAEPRPGEEFAAWASRQLGCARPALAGPCPERLERVAVVGGSGGEMLAQAKAAGAQMLITGEARYHAAEEAADLGLALLTLGHYQTEAVIVEPWARRLAAEAAAAGLDCRIEPWLQAGDPWRSPGAGQENY